jgi:hypothetical protein
MPETARFALPLLEAAQAQKHVTVNEALARLDALAAARVEGLGVNEPPADAAEGEVYGIGSWGGGEWHGQAHRLAVFLNGGWDFADPPAGWQVWNAATGTRWTRAGTAWIEEPFAVSPGGAATIARVAETDHALGSGPTSTTAAIIPDKAIVLGVSARVIDTIGGAGAWDLGVPAAPGRYGTGFGTEAGSHAEGVTGQPQAYYGGTPLVLSASGGDFAGGTVRLAVHYLAIAAPPG